MLEVPKNQSVVAGEAEAAADPPSAEEDRSDEANSEDDDSKQGKEEDDESLVMLPGRLSQNEMRPTMQPRMQLPPMQPMNLSMGLSQAWNHFHNPTNNTNPMATRDHYRTTRPEYDLGLRGGVVPVPRASYPNLSLIAPSLPPNLPTDRGASTSTTRRVAPAPPAPAAGGTTRPSNNANGRSMAFRVPELLSLANIMEDVLPIGNAAWQRVEAEYNTLFPDRFRSLDSLRRKFNWMKDSKIPTGDPSMPYHIRVAKRAHYKIVDRSECCTGMSDEDEAGEQQPAPADGPAAAAGTSNAEKEQDDSAEQQDEDGSANKKRKAKKSPAYANRKNKAAGINKSSELLEVFMMQRAESQERREQLESQRMQSNQMLMSMFASAVTAISSAFTGNVNTPTPGVVPAAAVAPPRSWHRPSRSTKNTNKSASDDEDESLSTIDTFDSPPTKRLKKKQRYNKK